MTIDHASAVWGYGVPSTATIPGAQSALRRRRLFPVAPTDVAGSVQTIRPYVIPWTPTVDGFGVAFPAGLVGVTTSIRIPPGWGGTINAGYENSWENFFGNVPVPGVLPAEYTPNLDTPWTSDGVPLLRIRTAAGFTDQVWGPAGNANGISDSATAYIDSPGNVYFDGVHSHWWYSIGRGDYSGFRKLQYRIFYLDLSPRPHDYSAVTPAPIRISHNADGTFPGGAAHGVGDTIDHTHTLNAGDLAPMIGGDTTDWIDAGSVLASRGVMTDFCFEIQATISWGVEFRLSPRVDVPYVLTVTGQGDLVAPGGIPT